MTKQRRNGIRWTFIVPVIDDLDFADYLALLPHNHQQMQDKSTWLMEYIFVQVSLSIHKQKSKVVKMNKVSAESVLLESSPL